MIAPDIPDTIELQLKFYEIVTDTFAKTIFCGGVAPYDNPKILAGEEIFSLWDPQVRLHDPQMVFLYIKSMYLLYGYINF